MRDSLGTLVEALQQAVDRAQEQLQSYQLRMLREYFDEENRPRYVSMRLPKLSEDGAGLEHREVEVPRLSLVQMGTMCLDELDIDLPLWVREMDKETGQLLVEFSAPALGEENRAHLRLHFKNGGPTEAVMKLNDTLMNIIP